MDRYSIPVHPSVAHTKKQLDIFVELFFNYHFLSRVIFTTRPDRQACYNAFKGFSDILRFNEVASSGSLYLKTRHETITSASDGEDSPLKYLILDFLSWRDTNFSLSNSDTCSGLIRSAYSMAFHILNGLSESINSEVSKLDETQGMYEVKNLEDATKENLLHPVSIEPKWTLVSEDILKRCSPNVKGVWLAYFHFIIVTDNAIGNRLHEVTEIATSILRQYRLKSPDYYRFPAIITEDMLRALLCSCYTVNPFLFYDFLSEDRHFRVKNIIGRLTGPPHCLLWAMARDALSIQPSYIRQNFANQPDSMRLYRNVLKIIRLRIFFSLRKIILPHEQVLDYYKESFPEDAGWIIELKQDSEQNRDAWSTTGQDIFIRYYPKVRALIDSMAWVFNSTLTPERLRTDIPSMTRSKA
jgi:hypothetical protein